MMEPIRPSVWRRAKRNTALSVSAVVIARSESCGWPPGVVHGSARQVAIASSVNQTVRLPRWRKAASYSAQFVTRRRCLGIWWRRAALALNGIGDPGSQKGASSYASHLRTPTTRSVQQTPPGGQPHYSDLAITTALTLKAVFRLALRQTEGLIGSVIRLLGLDLSVPDHTTLSRRAETLEVPRPRSGSPDTGREAEPLHRLVDGTGLKLCGAGEWLVEKHGTRRRRAWRKMHIGVDADTGRIVASELTPHDADDGAQVGPLLDQVAAPLASFTGDGVYDQEGVYASVGERHPDARIIVPPRSTAVPSQTAETAPTQRDRHLELIAEKGRMGWQKASGYNWRARAEATIGRWKRVIGDGLHARTDEHRATEMDVAVHVLNRMLELGRPESVRIA